MLPNARFAAISFALNDKKNEQKKYYIAMILLIAGLLFKGVTKVSAQDSIKLLRLVNAIASTINNNKAVQLVKLDESIAASNYKQTEAIYLPHIGFSYTAMSTNSPFNVFGFKLEQKSITENDFNPALQNYPGGTGDFTTAIADTWVYEFFRERLPH